MGHYVYKYVYDNEIIYIGKNDTNLVDRLNQHGKPGDNIDKRGWPEINSARIYYIELESSIMSDVVESELIRRYQPKYNIAKMSQWSGLPFTEPEWIEYVRPSKTVIKEPRSDKTVIQQPKRALRPLKCKDYYSLNKNCIRLLNYICDSILTGKYFIAKSPFEWSDGIDLYIAVPDWCIGDGTKVREYGFYDYRRGNGMAIGSVVTDLRTNKRWFHTLVDCAKERILEVTDTLEEVTTYQFGSDDVPDDMTLLRNKTTAVVNHWDTLVRINDDIKTFAEEINNE